MSDISGECASCGASIYRQHIDSGIARYEGGKMLCSHCVVEYEREHEGEGGPEFAPIEFDEEEGEEEEEVEVDLSQSRVHSASTATLGLAGAWSDDRFNRQLDTRAIAATRCRTFHAKLSEGAMSFLNNQINEWIDGNPNITVKFATSAIGIFEGKHAEPNLILTLFY